VDVGGSYRPALLLPKLMQSTMRFGPSENGGVLFKARLVRGYESAIYVREGGAWKIRMFDRQRRATTGTACTTTGRNGNSMPWSETF